MGITPCTPNGFIGRLKGMTNINGNVKLMLEPAGLLDAFEKLVIDINRTFTPEEVQTAILQNEGITLASNAVMADVLEAFEFDINKILYDHDGDENSTYDQVVAEGSLSITPSLDVYANITKEGVEELSFIVGLDEEAQLEIQCGVGISVQKEYLLGELNFQFPAGPVLIGVPVRLYVGANGQLSATVSASLDQSFEMQAGLTYNGANWEMISDFEPKYEHDLQIGAEANCNLKGYIEPEMAVLVYNIIGAKASLQAYLEMNATDSLSDFSWEFYAGMLANIGVEASLPLGFMTLKLFDMDYPVIDFKKLLASFPNGTGGKGSWPYRNYNLAGTACDPNGSTVNAGLSLSPQFTIPDTDHFVLTGDVDGDKESEIITISGSSLNIYSGNGALEKSITLPRPCQLSMLEDADGDGVLDIGLGGSGHGFTGYIYKADGTLLKTLAGQHGGSYGDHSMTLLTMSGGKVLVGYNAGYSRTPRGVASFDYATGTEDWYYQIGPANGLYSIADIDNNGVLDITMNSATVHNGASGNGTTDGDLYLIVVDELGTQKISLKYPSPSNGDARHVFQDMDNNGDMDIVAFEGHDPRYYHGQSQIHLYDNNGFITHTFNGPLDSSWQYAIGDLENNGTKEIIVSASHAQKAYVLNNQLQKLNEVNTSGHVKLICDVTGNGNKEIVMLSPDGWLKVFDKSLNLIDQVKCGSKNGSVISSDVDGDGIVDLLVQTDQLYVYSFLTQE
ncbi:MAG: VCBS repeat-containing protein [Desulfobacterium sp.]|nr:VCBS repeat-containing protein [Desulfobacterium sp.]